MFPRNLAVARFYFKAPFGVTTWGQRLQRLTPMCIHSFNNKPIYMHSTYNACAHMYKRCQPFTMQRDFEGGVY